MYNNEEIKPPMCNDCDHGAVCKHKEHYLKIVEERQQLQPFEDSPVTIGVSCKAYKNSYGSNLPDPKYDIWIKEKSICNENLMQNTNSGINKNYDKCYICIYNDPERMIGKHCVSPFKVHADKGVCSSFISTIPNKKEND